MTCPVIMTQTCVSPGTLLHQGKTKHNSEKHTVLDHIMKLKWTGGIKTQLSMSHIHANIKPDFLMMGQTHVTYVLLIIPTGWVNNQKWLVGFSSVVTNNVITYSVRLTSSRKLDVLHDKRKQLVVSGDESISLVNQDFSFVWAGLQFWLRESPGVN